MADINDLRIRLANVKKQVQEALPDMALTNTIAAKALIERNIRDIGFGAHYSNNKLPAWFFEGKAKSKAGEAYIKSVEKRDQSAKEGDDTGMTWAELRTAEGLPTDHVNLSFTNKMFAGLGPLQTYFVNGVIYCPLGGSTQEVVDKLNWNRERYGDFLGKVLTNKELEVLRDVILETIGGILKNNGF